MKLISTFAARHALLLAGVMALSACGGGGGGSDGGGGGGGNTSGDAARRAVLKDLGEQVILPALRDFEVKAAALKTAGDAWAAAAGNSALRDNARAAWKAAMASWQRSEVLQVGPAGRSSGTGATAGGENFRDFIYSWFLTLRVCDIEAAAAQGSAVTGGTPIDTTGLGALEHLLFTDAPPGNCADQPNTAQRAAHAKRLADRLAVLATNLRNRWEPGSGNGDFIAQWSNAGAGSAVYSRPRDALNALSVALFYVEKSSKDRKIALTTGVGATGLSCNNPASCPEFLESRLARHSGANIAANVQAFKDVFTGLNGGLGMNSLLEGIGRQDLANEIVGELNLVLAKIAEIENSGGFDAAVEAISNRNECVNASSSSSGLPPCALHGLIKTAMDTYRGPIVGALSLAIPDDAAGDND